MIASGEPGGGCGGGGGGMWLAAAVALGVAVWSNHVIATMCIGVAAYAGLGALIG